VAQALVQGTAASLCERVQGERGTQPRLHRRCYRTGSDAGRHRDTRTPMFRTRQTIFESGHRSRTTRANPRSADCSRDIVVARLSRWSCRGPNRSHPRQARLQRFEAPVHARSFSLRARTRAGAHAMARVLIRGEIRTPSQCWSRIALIQLHSQRSTEQSTSKSWSSRARARRQGF